MNTLEMENNLIIQENRSVSIDMSMENAEILYNIMSRVKNLNKNPGYLRLPLSDKEKNIVNIICNSFNIDSNTTEDEDN